MTRGPCCQKTGLKKGPWSAEEDEILIAHINNHGHSNWRALPKQAGLLRCGKSCRLRWTNYLNPDIKRGNFSREEEDMILNLHRVLGNRWSAIAAKLPGRTDNEIKNVWHTHLKKRLANPIIIPNTVHTFSSDSGLTNSSDQSNEIYSSYAGSSSVNTDNISNGEFMEYSAEYKPEIDERFWSDQSQLTDESSDIKLSTVSTNAFRTQASFEVESMSDFSSNTEDDVEFWCNLLLETGGMTELPEF
ncbi:hypothetical protein QQ045_014319 [Rhodiola kirilowii]